MSTKLIFKVDYSKEYWFVKNQYKDARKLIGDERFSYIIKNNISNFDTNNFNQLQKNVLKYLKGNRIEIQKNLKKQKRILKNKWNKINKRFFTQIEETTHLKWKYNKYNIYLVHACFWGGDYDPNEPNIYINPLIKHGDPLYIIFHELSHLIFWEYIYSKYSKKFIKENEDFLWQLSEIMVNYPLLKIKIDYEFPLIIPLMIKNYKRIVNQFSKKEYLEIIENEVNKKKRQYK